MSQKGFWSCVFAALLIRGSIASDLERVQDNLQDHVMLFLNISTGTSITLSLARQGDDAYQYRVQFTDFAAVSYTHTASAAALRQGDSRTVLFRFNAESYKIVVEEVYRPGMSPSIRTDVTGDSSSFESQVRCAGGHLFERRVLICRSSALF